jgi:hypothetical protein
MASTRFSDIALTVENPRATPLRSAWVRGPVWDSFWMLSALWMAPLIVWLFLEYSDAENSPLDQLYFVITALFWIGHRLSSSYLAYCTEAYRPLLRSQPIRFVVLPLLVTACCFAVFLPSDSALPWNRAERLVVMAVIDYVFVTYHFATQHFGALSLYRTRVGRSACVKTRRMDRIFALSVGGVLVLLADLLAGSAAFQDKLADRWNLSAVLSSFQDGIRTWATVVLVVATAAFLFVEFRSPQWSLPRVLYVLGITVMVALALNPPSPFLFLVIWTSQHWILATGLAAQVPVAEAPPKHGLLRRILHMVNTRPWAVLGVLITISVLLLPIFEVEANRQAGGTYYGDRIFGALVSGLRNSTWVPVLLALGFSTGFLHYILDRSVYRMSNPEVRGAARGLLEQRGRN